MSESAEPRLAAPGAGLPALELVIGRLMFSWRRWRGSREEFNSLFESERRAILQITKQCRSELAARRVLIPRVRGLEDSSRYWSVWMTLDHLRIVNNQISRIIDSLSRGVVPAHKASTATIKPDKGVTSAVVPEYVESCDKLLNTVREVPNLKTAAQYAHPWFGPLDAFGWHALAGGHMGIHRRQLDRIAAGLEHAGVSATVASQDRATV
jgi:hypothetical protein